VEINYFGGEIVPGRATVIKNGWGYAEAEVSLKTPNDWLKLKTTRLNASDFGADGAAEIRYEIDTAKFTGKLGSAVIVVSNLQTKNVTEVSLSVKRRALLKISTDKESYPFDGRGTLIIENYSGAEISTDVSAEQYIKFEGKTFSVGERREIPFYIKCTAFQMAQLAFKRLPFIEAEVTVTARVRERTLKKTLVLKLGNTLLA